MSTTKACTNLFPVLLCTTKLAKTTSQYYFVLQSLHKLLPSTDVYYKSLQKLLPSTTLYYKACTNYFPVLLCTTQSLHKLLPSTDVYYKSLQKLLPSTTLYYKACTSYFPVLLCTTKLAQTTSQYYFVLHKACKIFFPVLLCITSSTAQGGGGSVKNRKPIGEVRCCESGMAERSHCWSER